MVTGLIKSNLVPFFIIILICLFNVSCKRQNSCSAGELFRLHTNVDSRWVSFENQTGLKGNGGMTNKGAKGHPCEILNAGESKVLLDISGSGIIHRIWITLSKRDPITLRALKIEIYWDHSSKPAVQAPFGDFFCDIFGITSAFENELFSNPEGRSFNCCIPMPFKKGAKIIVTNESKEKLDNLFYDVDYEFNNSFDSSTLYLHAWWNREQKTEIGSDYTILPRIQGQGRYLGTHIGVIADSVYKGFWWGEGEFKVYLDGDKQFPTIVGTGTEDFVGSGWGLSVFINRFQGCLLADNNQGKYSFYRYHIKDPIFFYKDINVTMQQIGGGKVTQVMHALAKGVKLKPITVGINGNNIRLLDTQKQVNFADPNLKDCWMNFYRSDDWSSIAFFYLNSSEDNLPSIQDVDKRTNSIK